MLLSMLLRCFVGIAVRVIDDVVNCNVDVADVVDILVDVIVDFVVNFACGFC